MQVCDLGRPIQIPKLTGIEFKDFNLGIGFHQCIFLCIILKCIKIVHKICDSTLRSGIHGRTEFP